VSGQQFVFIASYVLFPHPVFIDWSAFPFGSIGAKVTARQLDLILTKKPGLCDLENVTLKPTAWCVVRDAKSFGETIADQPTLDGPAVHLPLPNNASAC
jgi:hypothetical protein